jgi:hypothetical protein
MMLISYSPLVELMNYFTCFLAQQSDVHGVPSRGGCARAHVFCSINCFPFSVEKLAGTLPYHLSKRKQAVRY